jgi:hypothetical protein
MLKDMQIAIRYGLSQHLELGVTAAARDRLLEQMQRGYGDEDYSAIARKYLAQVGRGSLVEADLELFEKPAPVEPYPFTPHEAASTAHLQKGGNLSAAEQSMAPELAPNLGEPLTPPDVKNASPALEPLMQNGEDVDVAAVTHNVVPPSGQAPPEEEEPVRRRLFGRLLRRTDY